MKNFSIQQVSLAQKLLENCRLKNQKIVCAESCTGGLLAGLITEIGGASAVLDRGFVVYSNQAKIDLLGVSPQTLERYGAVSSETAREMAMGAKKNSAAQIAVAITGIAGPDGGSFEKPVGTVFIAIAFQAEVLAEVLVKKFLFESNERSEIRRLAVGSAIEMILEQLSN